MQGSNLADRRRNFLRGRGGQKRVRAEPLQAITCSYTFWLPQLPTVGPLPPGGALAAPPQARHLHNSCAAVEQANCDPSKLGRPYPNKGSPTPAGAQRHAVERCDTAATACALPRPVVLQWATAQVYAVSGAGLGPCVGVNEPNCPLKWGSVGTSRVVVLPPPAPAACPLLTGLYQMPRATCSAGLPGAVRPTVSSPLWAGVACEPGPGWRSPCSVPSLCRPGSGLSV